MQIDPRHLEILWAITERGGLTEGAEVLGKSQPSVSRTVAALEARLGQKLFEPGRRPLRPTELGRALAAQGARVAEARRAAEEVAERHRTGRSGAVRLAGTPLFMDGVIAGMVAEFQRAVPGVRIEQDYGYPEALVARLEAGSLDVAICPMRPRDVPEGLRFTPILTGRNVIACGASHPLARRRSVRREDVARYPWIAPPVESPLYEDLRGVLLSVGVTDFRVSFTGGSLSSVVAILGGSDALTVLPYSVVFMLRRQRVLAALPVRIDHPARDLGCLVPAGPQRPAARRLCQHVEAEFAGLAQTILRHEQDALWRA